MPCKADSGQMPRNKRGIKPGYALLVGTVKIADDPKPALVIDVYCPFCMRRHRHGWSPNYRRADCVAWRTMHCCRSGSPFGKTGYFIGLDPETMEQNREVFRKFDEVREAFNRRMQVRQPTPAGLDATGDEKRSA